MTKTLKYRIYPTKYQQTLLQAQLNESRLLYNHLLEQRRNAWSEKQENLTYYDQCKYITTLKHKQTSLSIVNSQVLQNVAARVDSAFQGFFRRVKQKQKPGYPRFKGADRYTSLTFPQYRFSWKLLENQITLSKIGNIKIKLHRALEGQPQTCTILQKNNKWYASITVVCNSQPLPKIDSAVGVDVGLIHFISLSNGEQLDNPRFFKTEQKALAKTQRKLSKQEKGSLKRAKARKIVARVHERISNKRHDFSHQTARRIVNSFGTICVEKLVIKDMEHSKIANKNLRRSIKDAAWGYFLDVLFYKAEEAGRQFVKVNPYNTSQTCSQCGAIVKKDLEDRVHNCSVCGSQLDRDVNAARNILRLGLQSVRRKSVEACA